MPALPSLLASCLVAITAAEAPPVVLEPVPEGGLQPQIVVDARGAVHLLYFRGDPRQGDLFYTRREKAGGWSAPPVRVNSRPGQVVAMGTIRGGRLAVDPEGRAHVVWNGAQSIAPEAHHYPLWYSRRLEEGRFEPERNLLGATSGLDGGGALLAGPGKTVRVFWHARPPGSGPEESHRRVFMALSTDGGLTFQAEAALNPLPTGTCACCTLDAALAGGGRTALLYRGAEPGARDLLLLVADAAAGPFRMHRISHWPAQTCPMSSAALVPQDSGSLLIALEEQGHVIAGRWREPVYEPWKLKVPGKHPRLAVHPRGEVLLAWVEGGGFNRGGKLRWRLFDPTGAPLTEIRRGPDLPAWQFPAIWVDDQGSFRVMH